MNVRLQIYKTYLIKNHLAKDEVVFYQLSAISENIDGLVNTRDC